MASAYPPLTGDRRRLLLFRHAKSDRGDASLADIDRPLNGRGRKAAAMMGRFIASAGLLPDLVICSSSERTRQTCELAFGAIPRGTAQPVIRSESEIYLAAPEKILGHIRDAAADVGCLMIIGHNPGMELLALDLSGSGVTTHRLQIEQKFPTGALAVIDFKANSWSGIESGRGELLGFVTPRSLDD